MRRYAVLDLQADRPPISEFQIAAQLFYAVKNKYFLPWQHGLAKPLKAARKERKQVFFV